VVVDSSSDIIALAAHLLGRATGTSPRHEQQRTRQ
jgi:hypothetical protein